MGKKKPAAAVSPLQAIADEFGVALADVEACAEMWFRHRRYQVVSTDIILAVAAATGRMVKDGVSVATAVVDRVRAHTAEVVDRELAALAAEGDARG